MGLPMGTWSFIKCYNRAPGTDWAFLPREDIKIQPCLLTAWLEWFIHNNNLCKGVDHNASLLLLPLKYQSNPRSNSRADESGYQKGKLFYAGHLVSLSHHHQKSSWGLSTEHLSPWTYSYFVNHTAPASWHPREKLGSSLTSQVRRPRRCKC